MGGKTTCRPLPLITNLYMLTTVRTFASPHPYFTLWSLRLLSRKRLELFTFQVDEKVKESNHTFLCVSRYTWITYFQRTLRKKREERLTSESEGPATVVQFSFHFWSLLCTDQVLV